MTPTRSDRPPCDRMSLVGELEGADIKTLEASSADHAIEILTDRTNICVVVTDIEMPGSINALGLARMVQDRRPPIHVIVASGRYLPELGDPPERYNFFAKPYDVPHLMSVIKAHVS